MDDDALEAEVRRLLEAGADPNTRGGEYDLPVLYSVTGYRNAPRIARMLLEAGASPDDGESAFHAAERYHVEALELLLEYGVDLNLNGDWGNTPLYFLLRHWDVARHADVGRGLGWLLDHGADPDVRCGDERETSLHVAARNGQAPEVVRLLLDRGADVHARRGDGRSAWLLAMRGDHEAVARVLEEAGAEREDLSPADEAVAAAASGDPEAPVDAVDENGATALHNAAIRGDAAAVSALLARGADRRREDPQHHSTPLGWAEFGRDQAIAPDGDYEACIRALATDG